MPVHAMEGFLFLQDTVPLSWTRVLELSGQMVCFSGSQMHCDITHQIPEYSYAEMFFDTLATCLK